jgi:hypothetical protein
MTSAVEGTGRRLVASACNRTVACVDQPPASIQQHSPASFLLQHATHLRHTRPPLLRSGQVPQALHQVRAPVLCTRWRPPPPHLVKAPLLRTWCSFGGCYQYLQQVRPRSRPGPCTDGRRLQSGRPAWTCMKSRPGVGTCMVFRSRYDVHPPLPHRVACCDVPGLLLLPMKAAVPCGL